MVPKAGLVGPPLHSPHQTSRSDVSRPCPSHPPRTAGVAGRQSHCLLTHSLGPKPQRTPPLLGLPGEHTRIHTLRTAPPTRSHTHTPAGTMSRRPAHPLDSSVLMGPGGRGGRPGELPGPQLTEEMPESPAQLWNCVTTGAAGTKAQSHYPRLGGRREDASIPQLSSHTPILEWFAEHRLCADPLLGVSNHIRHALGAGGMEVDTGRGD